MRVIAPLLVASLALVLTACGSAGPVAGESGSGPDPTTPTAPADPRPLYEAGSTVLEDESHGPMLCLGGVRDSLPPQCGEVPLEGWDWEAVAGEQSVGRTTWGMYHVVGTYDGTTFAVTEVRPYEREPTASGSDPDFTSPCAAPAGGWPKDEGLTQEEASSAHSYARSQADYVTSWVTHLDPDALEFSPVLVNAIFTGERERHEAEIRKRWPGPLCVVERDVPSAWELSRIRKEAESSLDGLGLQMLWSHGPAVEPVIEVGVVADPGGEGQAALDARFGSGTIRLFPALEPAS